MNPKIILIYQFDSFKFTKFETNIIFFLVSFFTPILRGGFPLGSEWQQVSLDHQDSSQYFSQSQLA